MNTTAIGTDAEQLALRFLQQQGMKCLAVNARTRFYELDLVMRDGDCIVAVEVKYRKNTNFGGGEAAISTQKAYRLRNAIMQWVVQNGFEQADQNIRIDVVVITGSSQKYVYYPNAVEDG